MWDSDGKEMQRPLPGLSLRVRARSSAMLPGEERRIVVLVHSHVAREIRARLVLRTQQGRLRFVHIRAAALQEPLFHLKRQERLAAMQ